MPKNANRKVDKQIRNRSELKQKEQNWILRKKKISNNKGFLGKVLMVQIR